ncbi:MAG: TIGR02530 family flagellar biosynthesis protein [Wujia sp.]
MNGLNSRLISIEQATDIYANKVSRTPKTFSDEQSLYGSFQDILNQKTEGTEYVKFSKHANARLQSRNINLSDEQLGRLNNGVAKARDKSINESLVMMDDLAFIVNVKNNTVVTALDQNDDSVFTNIDGAVIV